jgi:hypothetical protein
MVVRIVYLLFIIVILESMSPSIAKLTFRVLFTKHFSY